MPLTRDQLANLPARTQIRASWDDNHQPPVIVTRIDGDSGEAATGGYILAATEQWLEIATWGANIELLHVPAPEGSTIEEYALDTIIDVRDAHPRTHNDAPSEAIVEALMARGLLVNPGDADG